jgi:cytochrome P450
MRTIDDLPVYEVFQPSYQADPHEVHRSLRSSGPLARNELGPAVLSHDLALSAVRDRRFQTPVGLALSVYGVTEGPVWDRVVNRILSLDGEEHQRLRRLVAKAFMPRMADRLRSTMRSAMASRLDSVGPEFDVVEVVQTYPIAVICDLLGIPERDWMTISRLVDDVLLIFHPDVTAFQPRIIAAFEELDRLVDALADERRSAGLTGEDLISELLRAEDEGDRLTHAELRMLVGAVLTAGTDTTRNQLAAGIETFCRNPEQWRLLRERPELASKAAEEIVRYCPVVLHTIRTAVEDVTIGGCAMPKGTFLDIITSAANRDPAVYPDPDRFDIARENPVPHLTFGGGIHYCFGVHLAKAELTEALTQMAMRWETIELAGASPWRPVLAVTGPLTLPVRTTTSAPTAESALR